MRGLWKIFLFGFWLVFCDRAGAQSDIQPCWRKRGHYLYGSLYFPASDGTRLAVDVHLPGKKILRKNGGRVPAVFYLTRYVRSLELKWPYRWLKDPYFGQVPEKEIRYFNDNGYAVVIMDARGSGASFGKRDMDFSEQELEDAREVLDWIVRQSWCSGKIGTTGVSYLGTTAELLLATGHPALKACVPRSAIFDLYADMAFPGGVRQGPFVDIWGATTRALDRSDFSFFGGKAKKFVRGAHPVTGDRRRRQLQEALRQHSGNYDVYSELKRVICRDELHPTLGLPLNSFSVHSRLEKIIQSGVPIFRIGGWYDGALSSSVVKGLWQNPNTRYVLLGPWDHGPRDAASPYGWSPQVQENVLEQVRLFLDATLKGDSSGILSWPKVRFFNVGRERWVEASCWPVADSVTRWFFSADSTLQQDFWLCRAGSLNYGVDYSAHTGGGSRWNSQTPAYRYTTHTGYPDRADHLKKYLTFRSAPLRDSLWIDGHIRIQLPMYFDNSDPQVFVYVDEEDPQGRIRYISEGMLRIAHRQPFVSGGLQSNVAASQAMFCLQNFRPVKPLEREWVIMDLLPISYTVPAGHRLLISIAGADSAHFDNTDARPSKFVLDFNSPREAQVIFPVGK
ncbi:MAG: CocE/NonD family hydrolase [Flavobacteriales bacterium]|nr:CocE/NonD family hydrolase [Flavobacteriales bacterium]